MKISWLRSLTDYIAIDLGSSRVRIWGSGGVLVDDACSVAIDTRLQKVIAVGQEAAEMSGRVAKHISVIFPISGEGIVDYDIVVAMLRAFLQKVFRLGLFFRPVMVVSVHSFLGEPEWQALVELLLRVGARDVYVVDEVLAAAIGAGVPVADASGTLVLHIGAGRAEVAMIALGSVVAFQSSDFSGAQVTTHLKKYLQRDYDLLLGTPQAEAVKIHVLGQEQQLAGRVRIVGQESETRSPKEIIVEGKTFEEIVDEVVVIYVELVRSLLRQLPPELSQDVIDKGMLLTGGSASLYHLAPKLAQKLGFPVSAVEQPAKAVIEGLGQVVANVDLFTESIGYRKGH